jgi:Dipeptidyl peptidase IV (DPP IV) N-terminal region
MRALFHTGVPGKSRRQMVVMAATGVLALAVLVAVGQPAHAAYLGSNGLIAFVRGGNIYTINPESATPANTVMRLTHDGRDSGPRWSPDGKQIAYLDRGNLWVMNANGSHKSRITNQAPAYTDSRPTWSPNGRYIAFVKTARHAKYGYLTRYDTVLKKFVTFSMPYQSEQPTKRQVSVTALPAAVAWAWALNATGQSFGSFIVFEGATAPACPAGRFCLDALGFGAQSDYRNGFPSSENVTKSPVRQLDPDWYPIRPQFGVDVLTTREKCSAATCSPVGIDLTPTSSSPILPGAYEAVYSPNSGYLAYVETVRHVPEIFIYSQPGIAPLPTRELTWGTEPDWQPVAPFPRGG